MPRMIETLTDRQVAPEHCDRLGHMNVQYYVGAISDAYFVLADSIGLGPGDGDGPGVDMAAIRSEIDYIRELHEGERYRMESGVAAVGTKTLTLVHRMYRGRDGELAMRARFVGVCMDIASRTTRPLPDRVRELAGAMIADGPADAA